MQIIIFTLQGKYYGLNTEKVEEISNNIPSTMVPNAPSWVEGLINLRGNVVTLINLSKLLKLEEGGNYNNIILIRMGEANMGLLVTDVVEVLDVEDEKIETDVADEKEGISGIMQLDEHIVNIIDIDSLLNKNEGYI